MSKSPCLTSIRLNVSSAVPRGENTERSVSKTIDSTLHTTDALANNYRELKIETQIEILLKENRLHSFFFYCVCVLSGIFVTIAYHRFDEKESISGVQQLKSSVQKGIRSRLLELYPHLENHIDQVLPKKDTFRIVKCHDHIEIMVNSAGELLFFRHREGSWMPTLRLLHKYPFFLPMQQVDKGAIRFVLSGANIMCPGLTSPGARMSSVEKGSVVAVMAEGKQHALAVGITSLSTDDIAKVNKGVGIENCHYLNDGLWQMKPVK